MAAIGRIRQHYGILVIIIGLALLAFVLGDLMKSSGTRRATDVATVNGEKVTYQDFENRVQQVVNYQKSINKNLTRDDEFNIRNSVLNEMIKDIIMKKEYKALGITVSNDELMDMFIGDNPNQYILRNFSDENGNLDRKGLMETLENFYEMPIEFQEWWLNLEKYISEERMSEKYQSLLAHCYYLPKKLADRYNENKNLKREAEAYVVRYVSIPDSTVVVTEADQKAYYDKYYKKYPTDEMRGIDYVIFEVKPSEADRETAKKYIEDLKPEFAETTTIKSFVNYLSDTDAPFDSTWMKASEYPVELEEAIANNEVGYVFGPYEDHGAFNAARILGKEMRNDTLWASVAIIKREITAGDETDRAVFAEVNRFVTENKTAEEFNNAVETLGLNKRTYQSLRKTTNRIAGINYSREIVRWAFQDDVKVGDISRVFPIENMYVVAVLTKIVPEGFSPYEEMVKNHATQIIKEKKGHMIAEKAKAYGDDYDKMIEELNGEKITVTDISYDNRGFGSLGVEEQIGGTALGIKEGVFSKPIEGGNAFAIVKVTNTKPADEYDYNALLTAGKATYTNSVTNNAYNALYENAKVVNNGILFY
ncbi:MAG: SurA N-terminal domain-containing protein [Bacteroidales bacterium]|nr:SurA N-terminal domain-containing protein [Bacteroidales bacterium]